MPAPTRSQQLAWLAVGAVVVALGAWWVRGGGGDRSPPRPVAVAGERGGAGAGARSGAGGQVVVHVAGAVRRPGVYRVPAGTRIAAAVRRAGGATRRADLDGLNLAARVEDGRQILVPERIAAASAAAPAGGTAAPLPGTTAPPAPISLASATLEQLDTLPGVGPATAQAILAYRDEHGGFGSVDELDQVPGIGPATLEALRDLVTP